MKKMALLIAPLLLTGCSLFNTVGDLECAVGVETYCAGQWEAEAWLQDNVIDPIGTATCIDLVHSCPFSQCNFTGCGLGGSEAGDWEIKKVPDGFRLPDK